MSPWGQVSEHGAPQGQDRETEPHRLNMTVTVAGIRLAASHCRALVKMPDLWVGWEWFFGRQWVGSVVLTWSSGNPTWHRQSPR